MDNSVKNHWTATKFKVDLRNPLMYPSIKVELNVCNPYKDNEFLFVVVVVVVVQKG
jgi:hypothetical protein